MDAISRSYNINRTVNTDGDVAFNVPPLTGAVDATAANKIFPGWYIVPATAECTSPQIFGPTGASGVTGAVAPPNGSGAGKTKLLASATAGDGCTTVGRSSSGPGTSEASTTQFFAYALDALAWIKFTGNSVTAMSKDSLQKIYQCLQNTQVFGQAPGTVAAAPTYQDWSQVPEGAAAGLSGPIKRYLAQDGSGTGKAWAKMLTGSETFLNTACDTAFKATVAQENDATAITTDQAHSIYYYSYGQNYAQSKGVIADQRNKSVLGALLQSGLPVKAGPTTINTSATRYQFTRYVYNILDSRTAAYRPALKMVGAGDLDGDGATPPANGFICSNAAQLTLKLYGFVPLKKVADANNGGLLSYCALNPTAL
jgi:phosphate transport system substrate-binding protein